MIIGVLSDSHIPKRAKKLPGFVLESFRNSDYIIHAGDIMTMDVIKSLEKIAPVAAVAGNLDPPEIRERFGEKRIITLGNFNFGIFHGHGQKGKTMERAREAFRTDRVDCIIFGHSHIPVCVYQEGVLLFNPGSPTDKRKNQYYSIGLMELDKSGIRPQLLFFNAEGFIV